MEEPKMNRPVKLQSEIQKGREHRRNKRDLDVKVEVLRMRTCISNSE